MTTETGAGQWGAALSYAAKIYGLDCAVYQVKITMQQKPYRSSIMRTFGAVVEGSPSMSTRAGKDILTKDPTHTGKHYNGLFRIVFGKSMCYFMVGAVTSAWLTLATSCLPFSAL